MGIPKKKSNIKEILKTTYKKLAIYKSEINYAFEAKRLVKSLDHRSKIQKEKLIDHIKYWRQISPKVDTRWFEFFSNLLNDDDIRFVPKNIFHNIIEAKLNNRQIGYSYRDKNFYDRYYNYIELFPKTILRNIEGFFYNESYNFEKICDNILYNILNDFEKVIIKPSLESSSGRGVRIFIRSGKRFLTKDNEILNLAFLNRVYRKNYIIQEVIEQDDFFKKFNQTSVNTIRIHTYRSVLTDEVLVLNTIFRVGKKGSVVDNQSAGGVACNITGNGELENIFLDIYGKKYSKFNGMKFSQVYRIPKLDEMKRIAIKIGKDNLYTRIMGFDFIVDINKKVRLIEINNQYSAISMQMVSGPFFGNYTDEVINFCKA